ncbi:MAG TPA: outer membrane protein assembly factor BamD [Candidatus Sulfotelmatobacter sp.]|nr:outer membrane protein assembly factor BamD [Candidatus Sulfotelmatobacter sp.]
MRRFPLLLVSFALALACASECSAQIIFHKKKKVDKSTAATNTVEPDKQLYDKAMEDIKHGRHEVGRLGLQTLINTYPDSEYLAKAKLAIADSYFREGGSANITQAINGYKDFIVFFPFLPEAGYAQMQVAMANYNEMTKADRDNTHALNAEAEFQTFLQKYPKDPLAPQAEQRLREVQEVLAEGQYRIAYYYYLKGDRRAAAGRLMPLVVRYPLYSKSDTALWMLGDIFEKSERKDVAGAYYAQIIKNYPLSVRAGDARGKLKAFGMPVPQPDPKAMEWMKAEQNAPRAHESVFHKPLGILHSGPDVHMAAAHGSPNLQPQGEDQTGVDILSGGNRSTMGTGKGSTGIVATVKTGEPAPAGSSTGGATTEDVNSNSSGDSATGTTGTTGADSQASDPAQSSTPADNTSANASKADNTQPTTDNSSQNQNSNQKESSSKKKGLRKILPW